jgi:hypothetical protein
LAKASVTVCGLEKLSLETEGDEDIGVAKGNAKNNAAGKFIINKETYAKWFKLDLP